MLRKVIDIQPTERDNTRAAISSRSLNQHSASLAPFVRIPKNYTTVNASDFEHVSHFECTENQSKKAGLLLVFLQTK